MREQSKTATSAIVQGKLNAVTSALTWDEFSHVLERVSGRPSAVLEGERFLHFPRLSFQPCTAEVLIHAQRLRKETPLGARDSIHAATAQLAGATEFISEDSDFDGIPDLKRRPA